MTSAINGHTVSPAAFLAPAPSAGAEPAEDDLPTTPAPVPGPPATPNPADSGPAEPAPVAVPAEVAKLQAAVEEARAIVAIQHDEALLLALSPKERAADRRVVEKLRALEREQRLEVGKQLVSDARQVQRDNRWSGRARRARERLLNPNRRLAATYRRYICLSAMTVALVVIGVVWMSDVVHDGVVGKDGSWLGYLVGPLSTVLLVVSMAAQFTAVEHGEKVSKRFVWLDGGIVVADLLMSIVPWSLRYGWAAEDVIPHCIPPLLIMAAVVVNYMLNRLFGGIFQAVHLELEDTHRLSEQTADIVVLVERAKREISAGNLELTENGRPSISSMQRRFTVAKERVQLTGDALKLLQEQRLFP